MKKLIIFLFLAQFGVKSVAQGDTVYVSSEREMVDKIFENFTPTLYNHSLFNRILNPYEILIEQINDNYKQIHHIGTWMSIYENIYASYVDTTKTVTINTFANDIINFFREEEYENDEELRQPFALVLESISIIDSNKFYDGSIIANSTNTSFLPTGDQNLLYNRKIVGSACLLEFYSDNGFTEGKLIYDDRFIIIGENIEILNIKIDIGNGFQDFGPNNNELEYSREKDSTIAYALINYVIGNDTLDIVFPFYVTTKSHLTELDFAKAVDRWDENEIWTHPDYDLKFRVGIKYGCGNAKKIKRPIIIAPPYRPDVQKVRMNKYWDQFNFKSLFTHLSDLGYDVIFIKELPGNEYIDEAGSMLAEYIKYINNLKYSNSPNESWETILMGFSAGGQHCRYALMKLEKEHMENGGPHHHTRLYIPFDSPHLGANVGFNCQSVYQEFAPTNPFANISYKSLNDNASRGMLVYHIVGSSIDISSYGHKTITPLANPVRQNLMNSFENDFIHEFTNTSDLRKTYPTFSRNVSISLGHNSMNYTGQYSFTPGVKMFEQNGYVFTPLGYASYKRRRFHSSKYTVATTSTVFYRDDTYYVLYLVPQNYFSEYRTIGAYEYDMSQGGHKDVFYDTWEAGIVPVSPISILRTSASFYGTKYYDNHVNFLTTTSAHGINPTIWQNNNLLFDFKEEGLMYNEFDTINNVSNIFGYPHLAHPTNHFNITPFEAVFIDPQTYDHIKLMKSVEEDDLDDVYLVWLRDFIVNEVEAKVVCLQNKTIGKNHVQGNPSYKYTAWYKAREEIHVGAHVTPKTDPGDYIIESTGDITIYAGEAIYLKNGFHAQSGSDFHAYIYVSICDIEAKNHDDNTNNTNERNENGLDFNLTEKEKSSLFENYEETKIQIYPNPNSGNFTILVNSTTNTLGEIYVYDLVGKIVYQEKLTENETTIHPQITPGIYIINWVNGSENKTLKMIVQ